MGSIAADASSPAIKIQSRPVISMKLEAFTSLGSKNGSKLMEFKLRPSCQPVFIAACSVSRTKCSVSSDA